MTTAKMTHAWRNGRFVAAAELEHGGWMPDYLCVGCGQALIAKIGTRLFKIPHFAHIKETDHQTGEPRCSQRSLCPRMGGHFLRERIRRLLSKGEKLEVD